MIALYTLTAATLLVTIAWCTACGVYLWRTK